MYRRSARRDTAGNGLGVTSVIDVDQIDLDWGLKGASMLTFNEGKVCDAVVRRLEDREGLARTEVRWPEQEKHKFPVEIAFCLGDQLYALEHTGIEPFEGHLRMEAQTGRLFGPITNALKDSLGQDALFELYLPVNRLVGRKPAKLAAIQQAIIDSVKATAPNIEKRQFPDYRGTAVGPHKVAGVPFDLSLSRFEPPIVPGQYFQIKHVVDNIDKLRRDRMRKVVDKKFPKLAAWKEDWNARSVLVLEQNDIQLINPSIVADTFLPLAQARTDRPDETYLVASCMSPAAITIGLIRPPSRTTFGRRWRDLKTSSQGRYRCAAIRRRGLA